MIIRDEQLETRGVSSACSVLSLDTYVDKSRKREKKRDCSLNNLGNSFNFSTGRYILSVPSIKLNQIESVMKTMHTIIENLTFNYTFYI